MSDTDRTKQTLYTASLFLAGFLAFGIRIFLLGKQPITDVEAVNALQALGLSRGGVESIGSEPAYVGLTSILFFMFGAGNFGARLLPALSGAALALTPWLFRKQLGNRAALLLCFGLALDAGWTAISRQAFGMSWAGLFLVLALAALLARKSSLFGLFTALSVLGGSSFWQGAVGLGASAVLYFLVFRSLPNKDEESGKNQAGIFSGIVWKAFIVWFLGTLAVFGTLLLIIPNGINAAANGIVNYFAGWGRTSDTSVRVMLVGLALTQPLGLLFAGIGAVRAFLKNNALDIFLAVWWLVTLALALLYPAREMVNLGWAGLPMLALAARMISSLFDPRVDDWRAAIAEGLMAFALLVSVWLIFISFLHSGVTIKEYLQNLDPVIFLAIFALGIAFTFFAFWSQESASQGALWGLLAVLLIWVASAAWGEAGLGAYPESRLWTRGPVLDEVDLLEKTVSDLSSWKARVPGYVDLVVDDIDSPGLRWALRDYAQAEFVTSTSPSSSPPMVITADQPSPNLAETYRGQDFVLQVKPAWELMTYDQWLNWIAFKTVPLEKTKVVLWARADLFPDSEGFNP